MNLEDGSMSRKITIIESLPFNMSFTTPQDSIMYSKMTDQKRKLELELDISFIRGMKVSQFYWDDQNLVVELDNTTFLITTIEQSNLTIKISPTHSIVTNRNVIYEITFPSGRKIQRVPQKIAQKYIGKEFFDIKIGVQHAWFYFKNMPLLIFCTIDRIRESNELYLSWEESE
jgi:hypothetical protein